MSCCAHILNLIVKDGLKTHNDSILNIRNAVRYVRSSSSRLDALKNGADAKKIESKSLVCLDVETSWKSTYSMLDAALKFEKAFERLKEDDSNYKMYFALADNDEDNVDAHDSDYELDQRRKGEKTKHIGPPEENDWDVARFFIKFLKLFYEVTLQVSATLSVTSNRFFQQLVAVHTTLKSLSRQADPDVRLMASKMQKKFSKYWENVDKLNCLLYVATVLDSRYKLKFVRFCLDQVYCDGDAAIQSSIKDQVRKVMERLYDWYQKADTSQCTTQASPSNPHQAQTDGTYMDENFGMGFSLTSQFARQMEEDANAKTKSEFTRYLEEICLNPSNAASFDVLDWWRNNDKSFPMLAQMARDILVIPVSTVALESTFSTSGRILDPY